MDRLILAELLRSIDTDVVIPADAAERPALLDELAPVVLHNLAARGQWPEFDAIAQLAAELGVVSIAAVVDHALRSTTYPGDRLVLEDLLATLRE